MFGRYMNHSDLRSYKNMDHGSVLFSSLTLAPTIGFWSPKLDVMARKQWFIADTPSGSENFGRPRLILNFDNSFRLPWNFRLDIYGSYISAGDDNNFRFGGCWQLDFSVYKGFMDDRLSLQLQGEDMFRTGKPEWQLYSDRYVQTVSEESRRTIRLTLRYKLNPSESKYRGTGAGHSQRYRM